MSKNIEKTLAIIKPCAVQHRFSILRLIHSAGFHILQVFYRKNFFTVYWFIFIHTYMIWHDVKERCVKLSIAQIEDLLQHHQHKNEWVINVEEWSSGPLIALCLGRNDAIEMWKKLMGPEDVKIAKDSAPTSIRASYDCDGNPVYGSETFADAQLELQFFFPCSKI